MRNTSHQINKPTSAYIAATWGALATGTLGYLIGLWNADMLMNEKGFYLAVFLLGIFSAVTLQKTVRDRAEGLPVTSVFMGVCWAALSSSIALLTVGLINAELYLSEKGFYGIAFVLCLFAIITVQKNTRDLSNEEGITESVFPQAEESLDVAMSAADIL